MKSRDELIAEARDKAVEAIKSIFGINESLVSELIDGEVCGIVVVDGAEFEYRLTLEVDGPNQIDCNVCRGWGSMDLAGRIRCGVCGGKGKARETVDVESSTKEKPGALDW